MNIFLLDENKIKTYSIENFCNKILITLLAAFIKALASGKVLKASLALILASTSKTNLYYQTKKLFLLNKIKQIPLVASSKWATAAVFVFSDSLSKN